MIVFRIIFFLTSTIIATSVYSQEVCLGISRDSVLSIIETFRIQNPGIVVELDQLRAVYSVKGAKLAGHYGEYNFYIVDKKTNDSLVPPPPTRADCQKFGVDTLNMWTWRNISKQSATNSESIILDVYSYLKSMLGNPTEKDEKNRSKKFVWDFLNLDCKSYFLLSSNQDAVQLWVRTCRNIVH